MDEVLAGILTDPGAERAATEIMRDQLDQAESLARLVPMYEHLAQAAEGDRWRHRLTGAGLEPERVPEVVGSPTWPALVAGLRQAQAHGADATRLLADCITQADFTSAHDTAAVLHARLDARVRTAQCGGQGHPVATIAGVITPVRNLEDIDEPALAKALSDTQDLIAQRADELAQQAVAEQPAWITRLGPEPTTGPARARWRDAVTAMAAYRERHGITTPDPLGPEPADRDHWHARDHALAADAVASARAARDPATQPTLRAPAPAQPQQTAVELPGLPLENRPVAP